LAEIASAGKGNYIDGNKTQKAIDYVNNIISKANKTEFDAKQFSDYKDQFQWFIGFGLLFLLFDSFLLEKKTNWVQKLDLFNKTKN
jgi:Ca-activated chloride channel family protein